MELRNLKRWFVINKSIKTYNKRNNTRFKSSDIALLLAVSFASDNINGSSIEEIHSYLFSFNRGFRFDRLNERLSILIDLNLINKDDNRPVRYSLTIAGRNVLNELENRCRITRIDK